MLGSTYEVVTLPDDVAGRLEGKSSLGRLGLLTHSTAGFIDPGFSGHVTLELSNVATLPIKLWPGMKIGQLCLFRTQLPRRAPVRLGRLRLPLSGPARADAVPLLPELLPAPRSEQRKLKTAGVNPPTKLRVTLSESPERLLDGQRKQDRSRECRAT